jgi:hypothetical protein
MASRSRIMSRAESATMFVKITASKAANENARRADQLYRLNDPLEQAKTFLRSRGYHVFAAHVLGGSYSRSDKIVVGRTHHDPADVIAMADRMRR